MPEDPPAPPAAPTPEPPAPPPAPQAPAVKQFTDAELSRIMAKEQRSGEGKGQRDLITALGFDPDKTNAAAIKAQLDKVKAAEEAQLSEAEKAKRDAEADRAEAAKIKAEAAADRLAARKERALTRAGAGDDVLDDVSLLLRVGPEVTDDELVEAVGKLKERLPAMFTVQPAPPGPPGGRPGGAPPRPQPNGDAYSRGVERAAKLARTAPAQ